MEKGFIRKEVAEALSIPARRIQFFTDQGFITPEIENPMGRGTTRRYSKENVLEILIVEELSKNGVPLRKIPNVMFQVRAVRNQYWDTKGNRPLDTPCKIVLYNPSREKGLVMGWRPGGSSQVTVDMGRYSSCLIIDLGILVKDCPLF